MGILDRLRVGSTAPVPGCTDAHRQRDAEREIEAGNALEDAGRPGEALVRYEVAIGLAPGLARAHLNRGNALLALGDATSALAEFAEALARDPTYASAHYNMGTALKRLGQLDAAEAAYRSAIAVKLDFAAAEVALGSALAERGQHAGAMECFRRALAIDACQPMAYCNLAHAQVHAGLFSDAIASYRHALDIDPRNLDALNGLAFAEHKIGRLDDAKDACLRALAIDPAFKEVRTLLGIIQMESGDYDGAIKSQRQALHVDANFAEAHSNLGSVLRQVGLGTEAIASFRRAVELKPDAMEGHHNLATTLQEAGQLLEAVQSYRRAIAIDPLFADARTGLLFCLSHEFTVDARQLFHEHLEFGAGLESIAQADRQVHRNRRDPLRKLKVGFVSADLRGHPVVYFIEPILKHLASSPELALYAYHNQHVEDAVSARLRRYFGCWVNSEKLTDAVLAQQIRDDEIDILVDLSGHTAGNRLPMFARKPAPIQVSWIGYPGTTGLHTMDYYLADRHFLPLAQFEDQFTERLVYLPAVAPFVPDRSAPDVGRLPALDNGFVTFGSFNRLSKINARVVATWSRLLHALPASKLLIGAMPDAGQRGDLLDRFKLEDIGQERLQLHGRCGTPEYLRLYHRVDLCLDTFPYSGGTTTAHALWMGVPTLTISGDTPAGRHGATVLGQVGLDDYVASDADDFVRRGVRLASTLPALAAVREGLRARCEAAPSWHPELVAEGLQRAIRVMWKQWCNGLPPTSIDISQPGIKMPGA